MKKLSELDMQTVLWVEDSSYVLIITKAEVLEDLDNIKQEGKKVYTTFEYEANINAQYVIEGAIEQEGQYMYEDWDLETMGDVTNEDIEDMQKIFDRILNRGNRKSYSTSDIVEIDM